MYLFTLQDITRFIYIYPVIVNFPCFLNLFGSFLFSFSSACFINYFYFKQLLADLVDSNLVQTYAKEEDVTTQQVLYRLTSEGKNSLDLTIDVLPGIIKLKMDNILKNEFNNIISEDSIITEYIPENENSYTVKCKIVENNKTIFEVRTFAGSNEHAKFIADNWKENASIIYPKILELITGNFD